MLVHMRGARVAGGGRLCAARIARARSRVRSGVRRRAFRDARLPRDGHRLVAGHGGPGAPARARGRASAIASTSCTSASTRSIASRRCASTPRTRTSARSTAWTISPPPRGSSPTGCVRAASSSRRSSAASARGRWRSISRAADWSRAAIRFRARSGAGAARRPYGVDAVLHARRLRADLRRGRVHARVAPHARPVRAAAVSRGVRRSSSALSSRRCSASRTASADGRGSVRGAITF